MGPQQAYFINHPELVRDLLVVNADKFVKGRALQRAKTLLGNGLLTNEGEFHLRQRRMIQPAFHRSRIAEYARSMVEYCERVSESWSDGDVRDIDKEMMRLTLQIVAKTLFSADVSDEADQVGKAMTTLVEMFNYLRRSSDDLRSLYETPTLPDDAERAVDRARASELIRAAREERRTLLTEVESKAVLSAYGIPITDTRVAETEDDAVEAAALLGYPVVLKLHSHTITHKTDVGGVRLDLSVARSGTLLWPLRILGRRGEVGRHREMVVGAGGV
jgi:cytochrome P450